MLHLPNPDLMKAMGRYHPDGQAKDPHAHHAHALSGVLRIERRQAWVRRWVAVRAWIVGANVPAQSSCPSVGAGRDSARSAPEKVMGDRTPGRPSGLICIPRATT